MAEPKTARVLEMPKPKVNPDLTPDVFMAQRSNMERKKQKPAEAPKVIEWRKQN